MRVSGWLPRQRTEAEPPEPGWAAHDETMLLPAFVTGSGTVPAGDPPESPVGTDTAKPVLDLASIPLPEGIMIDPDDEDDAIPTNVPADPIPGTESKLPASERNMLVFVASLLAIGTLAVIAMMALTKPAPAHPRGTPATPTLAGHVFAGSPDSVAYCHSIAKGSTPTPPGSSSTRWTCRVSDSSSTVTFTPADVCHAQFGGSTIATYDRLNDVTTWHCFR